MMQRIKAMLHLMESDGRKFDSVDLTYVLVFIIIIILHIAILFQQTNIILLCCLIR